MNEETTFIAMIKFTIFRHDSILRFPCIGYKKTMTHRH